jgi:hypothetical protein
MLRTNSVGKLRVAAIEPENEIQFVILAPADTRFHLGQFDKQEALGKSKILLQKSIALKRARGIGQQGLVVFKTKVFDRRRTD